MTQTLTRNCICRSVTYISWSSDFTLYLEDYLMDKCHNWDIGSMWCKDLPHKKCVSQWPTFHGPVILFYILNTILWLNVIIGILVPCDAKIYLIKCMWVSDLHFMVQNVVVEMLIQYDTNVDPKLHMTYIPWSSDFALYLEDYFMVKCHNWDIGSMWCKDLPHKMYVGQWPTFHGPVILSYILKTVWWMNVVLEILIDCDTNFDLQIYM